jgi:hypothetical protein
MQKMTTKAARLYLQEGHGGGAAVARILAASRPGPQILPIYPASLGTEPSMNELTPEQKQRKSLALILEFAMGSTVASAIPTPVFEVSKQVALAATDVALCWRIYSLYYDKDLSVDSMIELLKRAGIVTAVGTVMIYTGARAAQGLVDESLNLTGIGTLVSGIIAGSSTAVVGLTFLAWINEIWQRDQLLLEPSSAGALG